MIRSFLPNRRPKTRMIRSKSAFVGVWRADHPPAEANQIPKRADHPLAASRARLQQADDPRSASRRTDFLAVDPLSQLTGASSSAAPDAGS
jgi:hypothetical protein